MDDQQLLYLNYLFLHPQSTADDLQRQLNFTKVKNRKCLRSLYHKKLIQQNKASKISLTVLGEKYIN